MYDLINHFAQTVVSTIPPEHVTDYEWLLQNVGQASTLDYQKRYRRFWAMNAAQLSSAFYATYFNTLVAAMSQPRRSAASPRPCTQRPPARTVRRAFSSHSPRNSCT